jgi:hypothetical protein
VFKVSGLGVSSGVQGSWLRVQGLEVRLSTEIEAGRVVFPLGLELRITV